MCQLINLVIHSQPILTQFTISIPPENVRKSKVFKTFSGDMKMEY